MTTFKQTSAPQVTALHRLYEAGEFQQALHLLGESDLLATLEKQPDDPELTGPPGGARGSRVRRQSP